MVGVIIIVVSSFKLKSICLILKKGKGKENGASIGLELDSQEVGFFLTLSVEKLIIPNYSQD